MRLDWASPPLPLSPLPLRGTAPFMPSVSPSFFFLSKFIESHPEVRAMCCIHVDTISLSLERSLQIVSISVVHPSPSSLSILCRWRDVRGHICSPSSSSILTGSRAARPEDRNPFVSPDRVVAEAVDLVEHLVLVDGGSMLARPRCSPTHGRESAIVPPCTNSTN